MSLKIRLNGQDYVNYIEASVLMTMEAVSGSFSFTATEDVNSRSPIKEGDSVDVIADDEQVIKGFAESVKTSGSPDEHLVKISGREILADLIDSTVGENKEFTGTVPLADIARIVLNDIGLTDVDVVDDTTDVGPPEATEITSADVGQGAFDFLEKYARKFQILLTTDGLGSLVLTRASDEILPVILRDGDLGNIINAEKTIDNSKRYHTYEIVSQLNPIFQGLGTSADDLSGQKGTATDKQIRSSRKLTINAEESSDNQTAKNRAIWECNIRRARSLSYMATIQGHGYDDTIWRPNNLIGVQDQINNIDTTMLIRSVTFSESIELGSRTALDCTYRDAYRLQEEQERRDALNQESAGSLFEGI